MTPTLIYVGGEFVKTNKQLDVFSPYDQELVGVTYLADVNILENAIQKALVVKEELKQITSYKKSQILKQISDSLITHKLKLAEILSAESAKPINLAIAEIERSIQTNLAVFGLIV